MAFVNPHFTIHTPVVELQDYLYGTTEERLQAYTVDWITRNPNMTAAQLRTRPRFLLTYLDNSMMALNLLSQHPELFHNKEFQTKYEFINQEVENVWKSKQQGMDTNVLLVECGAAMNLLEQVCQGLENLDPCVALVQVEGGGGEEGEEAEEEAGASA